MRVHENERIGMCSCSAVPKVYSSVLSVCHQIRRDGKWICTPVGSIVETNASSSATVVSAATVTAEAVRFSHIQL
jgi:hypothetical protein